MMGIARVLPLASILSLQFGVRVTADETIDSYVAKLKLLRERWCDAAHLVHDGHSDEGLSALRTPPPAGLDAVWVQRDEARRRELANALRNPGSANPMKRSGNWYLLMEQPALAAAAFEAAFPAGMVNDFQDRFRLAQALAEDGRLAEAADRFAASIEDWTEGHLRASVARRVRALRDRVAGRTDELTFVDQFYLGREDNWLHGRLGPCIVVAETAVRASDARAEDLLLRLLDAAGDRTGTQLVRERIAGASETTDERAASALLELGDAAHRAGHVSEAITRWAVVIDKYRATTSWPRAMLNTGTALKEMGDYRGAIGVFERLRDAKVNETTLGARTVKPAIDYRPDASWEIGLCRLALRDASGALQSFRDTRDRYPFRSSCGNAQAEFSYRYLAFEGICYEHLGRYDEAVRVYVKALDVPFCADPLAAQRLVAIHDQTGQLGRLEQICDSVDGAARSGAQRSTSSSPARWDEKCGPAYPVRKMLEIRALADRKAFAQLVEMLQRSGSVTAPATPEDVRRNWLADEAARGLARHPEETLLLLIQRAESGPAEHRQWAWYALGLNGSPEAVRFLADRLRAENNVHVCRSLVFALVQAGQRGTDAVDQVDRELRPAGGEGHRAAWEQYQRFFKSPWPDLPSLQNDLKLSWAAPLSRATPLIVVTLAAAGIAWRMGIRRRTGANGGRGRSSPER